MEFTEALTDIATDIAADIATDITGKTELEAQVKIQQPEELRVLLITIHY